MTKRSVITHLVQNFIKDLATNQSSEHVSPQPFQENSGSWAEMDDYMMSNFSLESHSETHGAWVEADAVMANNETLGAWWESD